ncbi:hypothetical protein CHU92_13920 [Flavobacterium cyanobacteriorum]|uniref:Glycerophosphoryl diester phosphodiesterase membrane domain-containing protein n=1 Tax=Flavobacterium cyanobacteriorum TaxID=2022802 RepID=A0A255YUW8_9FLAO|nr:hypothetical protein [Flavobacterium cyanobacteriorum]OYQ33013.1 hypothetical protein CHU92_13920 [Flavobacterium cyanobacteriorum]
MFKLFKTRNFSDIFNDTFGFIKITGKNYFKNYVLVNSPFLLVLIVLGYFTGKVFFDAALSGFGTAGSQRIIEDFFSNNLTFFITSIIGIGLLFIIIAMINYSYPVIYMRLYEDNNEPTTTQIVQELKKSISKIILFALLWFISFLPVFILVGFVCVFLFVLIIGIPFAFIILAAVFSWMTLSFYHYLNSGEGYFTSFGKGLTIVSSKFWTHAGSTVIFAIIIYIVQLVISLIPHIFGMASIFTDTEGQTQEEVLSFMGIVALITFIITTISNYVLGNLIYINQGMIYYSYREENENHSAKSEIDLIGSDSE